jgi:hypothetical protein
MEDDADYYCALDMGSDIYTVIWTHGEVQQNPDHMLRMAQPLHAEEKVKLWDGQFHDSEIRLQCSVQSRICGHAAHPVSPWVYHLSMYHLQLCASSLLYLW